MNHRAERRTGRREIETFGEVKVFGRIELH